MKTGAIFYSRGIQFIVKPNPHVNLDEIQNLSLFFLLIFQLRSCRMCPLSHRQNNIRTMNQTSDNGLRVCEEREPITRSVCFYWPKLLTVACSASIGPVVIKMNRVYNGLTDGRTKEF